MNQAPFDPSAIAPGYILAGKYRVTRMLGKGGFGVVVAATHLSLGQDVAVKVLLADATWTGDAVTRFQREAQAAVRLKGEHAARVLDCGMLDNGSPYMVMELLNGQDLAQVIRERPRLPIPLAVELVLQASEALAEAHALGIVHRDVKPANLFLTARHDGTPCVKVVDFGMSKVMGDLSGSLTKTSAVLGTPFYMSPEQMRSSKNVDARSDIWSLGVVLHELLAGRVPYDGETLGELCSRVFTGPPDALRAARPDVPEGLERVVLQCLQKDETKRYPSLAPFAMDLAPFAPPHAQIHVDRILRTLGLGDRSSFVVPVPVPASRVDVPVPRLAASSTSSSSQGIRLVVGAGVFLALALALGAGVYFGRSVKPPDAQPARTSDTPPSSASAPPTASSAPAVAASTPPAGAPSAPVAAPSASTTGTPVGSKAGPVGKRPGDAAKPGQKGPDDGFGDFHVKH